MVKQEIEKDRAIWRRHIGNDRAVLMRDKKRCRVIKSGTIFLSLSILEIENDDK